jgi:16S rRNA A1518/A1519 N6-dimethyltransferase RsmA/KsgA/DIM1 with predicted DNA glycosylase/AP lyase activity
VEQRFTFDQVASVYRKARPAYPDALIDDVVSYADLKPNDRIFEVGCGTGQATKSFAERGFRSWRLTLDRKCFVAHAKA